MSKVGTTYYSHCTVCGRVYEGYQGQVRADSCRHSDDRPNAVDEMEKRLADLKKEFPAHRTKKGFW
jgi:hypothetical protein